MPSKAAPGPATTGSSLGLMLSTSGVWWAVVLDGHHARLFVREHRRAPFRESADALALDAEGAPVEPRETGHHHGRYEQIERQFVGRIARNLERHAKADAFDHLSVFAAPIALGVLRGVLGPHTTDRLRKSIAEDLTGLSRTHIAARLNAGEI